jgi:hypothetical protein
MGTTAACFHKVGKYCWDRLRLKICLNMGTIIIIIIIIIYYYYYYCGHLPIYYQNVQQPDLQNCNSVVLLKGRKTWSLVFGKRT